MAIAFAGLALHAGLFVDAIGSRSSVVLVAGSLGGFTAPLVYERLPVREDRFTTL